MNTLNAMVTQYLPLMLLVIGALAFVVSVIIQVIKNIGPLKSIPTDLIVILLSVALTVAVLLAYASYYGIAVLWYYVVGAVICGFIVAFISMFGWAKFKELWARSKPDENG